MSKQGADYIIAPMLTIEDHRRDSAGMTYVYPVISRRAGGVSIGVNLNVNNACNWGCLYCQVEGLSRGGPPPIDLGLLRDELTAFLEDAVQGDFLQRAVPEGARRLMDVAFSGNGEPTSAAEFAEAVDLVCAVLQEKGLRSALKLRLITNGSLLHRPAVQRGIAAIGKVDGEVWFKVDRVGVAATEVVNAIAVQPEVVLRNLQTCADLAPTWVQTCWFALDGQAPDAAAEAAYCALLAQIRGLAGVHLYGLARPSMQPAAPRLSRMSDAALQAFAETIQKTTGLTVHVSP